MPEVFSTAPFVPPVVDLDRLLPDWARQIPDLQTAIPELAKDPKRLAELECVVGEFETLHRSVRGDARNLDGVEPNSVHLVLTSPPYWTLKEYRDSDGQMGHFEDYDFFLNELDRVWQRCFDALVPGGRLICVVGDVCLSRRKNNGRHTVVPLHASIQEHCRVIGFDNLSPIIWSKIANVVHEVDNGGGGFLGKPYEPNAVIKNDIEFILMERKPGGYRSPSNAARLLSIISDENHKTWFTQIWSGVTGASTRNHPAPYPELLANRLIRMFSFVGDTVLDPFCGSGTTSAAAMGCGRNSIGYEIDEYYIGQARHRISELASGLLSYARLESLDL
ncbi:MAG: site-specific DNA-methyltransferase [Pirellulaceae bacterium]|nr:site-specific DNA-methyltransferase [Pirellulaceae bacterium]